MYTLARPKNACKKEVDNAEVVKQIVKIKLNPDLSNWYKFITVALKKNNGLLYRP